MYGINRNRMSTQEAEHMRSKLLEMDLTSEEREFVEGMTADMMNDLIETVEVLDELGIEW